MKKVYYLLLLLTLATTYGQEQYTVNFKILPHKIALHPKPILIKVYSDWCAVCKIQDKKIEKDIALQDLLKNSCYYIKLNGETNETIIFNKKEYNYILQGASNGYHELAEYLTQGNTNYPCWVVLSSKYEILDIYNGLLSNKQLKELLRKLNQE